MTLSLRERRRQETAFQIHKATLELAMESGLEDVTTDEIAAASGVSTRTFFNYYPNKEAAAIGHPPPFTEAQMDALRDGTGPLAADIKQFLDSHMEALSQRADILRMVGKILRSNEKARGILDGLLGAERRRLTEALTGRVDNRQTATALAGIITATIGAAIALWEHEEGITLGAAMDAVWQAQMDAARLLLSSTGEETGT
ncbi:TetR/AcrR family transcriptional regulator [Thalassococcus sp. CAU 1522]|uniref:TetR/AcrR family transcriptional regulator n=1 Tax=Thalassococcus arenae TaxID=2851652 RepID=A0ABS6NBQ0_9RHOB|nr:TetR/AcrR family transcriptional regulator [Thalassococcus arenae]MBV2361454.1 TetR/AcrR family transcriptional regulator [Thalassococcus arenae]